jgi:hypothetical protein
MEYENSFCIRQIMINKKHNPGKICKDEQCFSPPPHDPQDSQIDFIYCPAS